MTCASCVLPTGFNSALSGSRSIDQLYEPLETAGPLRRHSDRFKVIRPIQQGSTATVYLAIDKVTKKKVAIKKYNPNCADHIKLETEFKIGQALGSHKHIGRAIDYSPREASTVFEYYGGGDLIDKITPDSGMPRQDALRMAMQVADALAHMHSYNIVHRDLKSDNICIDEQGNCRVIDFGVAQRVGEPVLTRLSGTIPYLSSEHFLCPVSCPTQGIDLKAVDMWALGIILFSAFTGRFPWRHASPQSAEFNRYVAGVQNEKELKLWAKVPSDVQRLVRELLSVDPRKRPTAEETKLRLCELMAARAA